MDFATLITVDRHRNIEELQSLRHREGGRAKAMRDLSESVAIPHICQASQHINPSATNDDFANPSHFIRHALAQRPYLAFCPAVCDDQTNNDLSNMRTFNNNWIQLDQSVIP